MKFFLPDQSENEQKIQQVEHLAVAVPESLHNITEGGEFLDDAIRMHEQLYMLSHIEESIAPGSATDMW